MHGLWEAIEERQEVPFGRGMLLDYGHNENNGLL